MRTGTDPGGRSRKDEFAKPRIRELVLRLGIFVGLEFEERMWGKRPIRTPKAIKQGGRLPMPDAATVLTRFPVRKKK